MSYRKSILALALASCWNLSPEAWSSLPFFFFVLCSAFLPLDWLEQSPGPGVMLGVKNTETLPWRKGPRLSEKGLACGFSCIACFVYRVFATRNTGTCPLVWVTTACGQMWRLVWGFAVVFSTVSLPVPQNTSLNYNFNIWNPFTS